MDIGAIFGTGRDLSVMQETARMLVVFAYGFVVVRVAGRRVFGKWSAIDIVVSILIGSNLSRAMTGNAPLLATLVATTGLLVLHWLLAQIAARSRTASTLLEGRAIDLVRDGRIDETVRRRHGVSHADLDEAVRRRGLRGVGGAAQIMLEPSGTITLIERDEPASDHAN